MSYSRPILQKLQGSNLGLLTIFAVTSVLLVVSHRSTARVVRLTDAALPLTELATLFCTLSTASPSLTTPTTSSNTSLWT